jgi:hypothetical protein
MKSAIARKAPPRPSSIRSVGTFRPGETDQVGD